jgi:GNAT superfamily N-acetyltransferase
MDETMGVRQFTRDDIDFAVNQTAIEGWFYTPIELERMLRMDPEGSFVFEQGGERLGFVTTVTYGRTGVMGHLIVDKKGRGRKIGDTLVQSAVDYMRGRGVDSMLLYATAEGARIYKRYGYKAGDEIWCIHSRMDQIAGKRASPLCSPILKEDLDAISAVDAQLFGDDRTRLIKSLFDEFPGHAFKIERGGRIDGYIFARPNPTGYDLGPWVCLTEDVGDADALFQTVLAHGPQGTLYLGVFFRNQAACGIAEQLPKVRTWRIPLMIRGEPRYTSGLNKVFGITAFELG